jgi:hypothetical protein
MRNAGRARALNDRSRTNEDGVTFDAEILFGRVSDLGARATASHGADFPVSDGNGRA